jgi:hypothetical protein
MLMLANGKIKMTPGELAVFKEAAFNASEPKTWDEYVRVLNEARAKHQAVVDASKDRDARGWAGMQVAVIESLLAEPHEATIAARLNDMTAQAEQQAGA